MRQAGGEGGVLPQRPSLTVVPADRLRNLLLPGVAALVGRISQSGEGRASGEGVDPDPRTGLGTEKDRLAAVEPGDPGPISFAQRRFFRQQDCAVEHDAGRPRGDAGRGRSEADPAANPDREGVFGVGEDPLEEDEGGLLSTTAAGFETGEDQGIDATGPGDPGRFAVGDLGQHPPARPPDPVSQAGPVGP